MKPRLLTALFVGLLGVPGQAQDAQQPPATPVFRTSQTLIEFTVVATDSKGNPVTDLKQEDFAGFHRQLAGPDDSRVRQEQRTRAVGKRARSKSRGDSRGLRSERPPIHRVRCRRIVGHGRRSGLEKRVP